MFHTGCGEGAVIDIEGDARECGVLQVRIKSRVRPPTISKTARRSNKMNNGTWLLALETWLSLVTLTLKILSSWTTLWHFIIDLHRETFQESVVSKLLCFLEMCLWGTPCNASQLPRHEHPWRYFSQENFTEVSFFWMTESPFSKLLESWLRLCIGHQLPGTCVGVRFCVSDLLLASSYFLFSFSWFLSPVYLVCFIWILC